MSLEKNCIAIKKMAAAAISISILVIPYFVGAEPIGETYRLSLPADNDRDIGHWRITQSGETVFYTLNKESETSYDLYRVPAKGGRSTKLTFLAPNVDSIDVVGIEPLASSGNGVVYKAIESVSGTNFYRLYLNPGSETSPEFRLLKNGGINSRAPVKQVKLSANDEYVVFRQGNHLYSSNLSSLGSTLAERVNSVSGDIARFEISPDSARILYLIDVDGRGFYQLRSALIDGSSDTKIDGGFIPGLGSDVAITDYAITPNSQRVVYNYRLNSTSETNLYFANVNGSSRGFIESFVGPLPRPTIQKFKITPNSQYVLYTADKNQSGKFELFVKEINGSYATQLSPMPFNNNGDVMDFDISPDGTRVVYRADQINNDVFELFSTNIVRNGGPFIFVFRLNANLAAGGDVTKFRISPNSQSVTYNADQDTDNVAELYKVPISSGPVIKLNAPLGPSQVLDEYDYTQDGSRVVFRRLESLSSPIDLGLYSVNEVGDVVRLDTPSDPSVWSNQISSDNDIVVFAAGEFPNRKALYAHSIKRDSSFCFPIVAKNSNVSVVCL